MADLIEGGIHRLVEECICATTSDIPIIIFDDNGKDLAECFLNSASRYFPRGMHALYVPIQSQIDIGTQGRLTDVLRHSIALSSVLITATTDHDECTGFRYSVVAFAIQNNLKIIHMPGVDHDVFRKSIENVDFRILHDTGIPIYAAMKSAATLEICTYDNSGAKHSLKASIARRDPHMCGGLAQEGEVMNFPTGEVYIAPNEKKTSGSIVLNGTTGTEILPHPEEIILVVNKGKVRIEDSVFSNANRSMRFREELEHISGDNADLLTVCEIGIGLNPAISHLTGSEIWDEKAFGTAHIALGANQVFGGSIKGQYHKDLVFYPKNIIIGGKEIQITWRTRPTK